MMNATDSIARHRALIRLSHAARDTDVRSADVRTICATSPREAMLLGRLYVEWIARCQMRGGLHLATLLIHESHLATLASDV